MVRAVVPSGVNLFQADFLYQHCNNTGDNFLLNLKCVIGVFVCTGIFVCAHSHGAWS